MSESPSRTRGRIPGGLLGMIGLVIAIELGVARCEVDLTDFVCWSWKQAGIDASRRVANSEVLCFGDSLIKFGLAPRVMEDTLRGRVRNLAAFAGKAPTSYVLLRRALEAGGHPSAVILECEQHLLSLGIEAESPRFWMELADLRDRAELARSIRDPDFFIRGTLGQLLPSIKTTTWIRASIMAALRGEKSSPRDDIDAMTRNWARNRGSQIMPLAPRSDLAALDRLFVDYLDRHLADFFTPDWRIDPGNASYLRKFLRLAEDRKIPVFLLIPPISPTAQARRESLGMDARYIHHVRSLQEQFPNVVVIDGRRSGYNSDAFLDPFHLGAPAAAALSQDVATVMAPYLSGDRPASRWVELPAFRARPPDGRLEDLVQSQKIVASRRTRRR